MAVHIYEQSGKVRQFSENASMTMPIYWHISPEGGIVEKRVFVRSDDDTESFSKIVLYPVDVMKPERTTWLNLAFDNNGSPGTWANMLQFSLNPAQEIPVWLRLVVPSGQPSEIYRFLAIRIDVEL
jgi:hypothetical protein